VSGDVNHWVGVGVIALIAFKDFESRQDNGTTGWCRCREYPTLPVRCVILVKVTIKFEILLTDVDGLANDGGIICEVVGGDDAASSIGGLCNICGNFAFIKNVCSIQRYPALNREGIVLYYIIDHNLDATHCSRVSAYRCLHDNS